MFESFLRHHPDQDFAGRVMSHLRHGARIGYTGPREPREHPSWSSVNEHFDAVMASINKDVARGYKAGPFPTPPFTTSVSSPMGAFQRKRSAKIRVIHDLSWPPHHSVNDYIDGEAFTVAYTTVDDFVSRLRVLGVGSLMAKLDLEDAYRHVLVHPEDWDLLGFSITNNGITQYYVECTLPFGLRSAPKLFNDVADALAFIMRKKGASYVEHYLDDFFTCGTPDSGECEANMQAMLSSCCDTCFTISSSPGKVVHPTTQMELLGIVLDTQKMEMRISHERLQDILLEIGQVAHLRTCKKRKLLSIIGKLTFVAKVVRSGRSFIRRLIEASKKVKCLHHHVTLTAASKQDLAWWELYLPRWNGVAIMLEPDWCSDSDLELFTDASNIALGVVFGNHWTFLEFTGPHAAFLSYDIAWRELYAITLAIATYGSQLQAKRILLHCDNMAIVYAVNDGTIRNPDIMTLIRLLCYQCAHFSCEIKCEYINTKANDAADAISRLDFNRFRQLRPGAVETPDKPADLLDLWHMC